MVTISILLTSFTLSKHFMHLSKVFLLNYNDMMIQTISNLSQHLKLHFKKDMFNLEFISYNLPLHVLHLQLTGTYYKGKLCQLLTQNCHYTFKIFELELEKFRVIYKNNDMIKKFTFWSSTKSTQKSNFVHCLLSLQGELKFKFSFSCFVFIELSKNKK